jgi:glycogen debranching enzyme
MGDVHSGRMGPPLLTSLKSGEVFVSSLDDGDISSQINDGCGLYVTDMRFLSDLHLEVFGDRRLESESSSIEASSAFFEARAGQLEIRRERLVLEGLVETITVRNHGPEEARFEVAIETAADFADIFEVRGFAARIARDLAPPARTPDGLVYSHRGTDGSRRATSLRFDPQPEGFEIAAGRGVARWQMTVPAGGGAAIRVWVSLSSEDNVWEPPARAEARARLDSSLAAWLEHAVSLRTRDERVDAWVAASLRDVHALITPMVFPFFAQDLTQEGAENAKNERRLRVVSAGLPWYVALFGRDALITAWELLTVDPTIARDQLLALAAHQATETNERSEAEPGKILHELRRGELACSGVVPNPYYGAADSTPLFLLIAALYHEQTSDLETIRVLEPNLRAALGWIDHYGDRDEDGFVEYERTSPVGLQNQGWKDSSDSVRHCDGSKATGSIALVEVQAYVFAAKRRIADVFEALGDAAEAATLREQADALKQRFENAFWMSDEGFYAMALDGAKEQVRTVTSNPGHALFCGISSPERATAVCDRLMAPDMFSGWGIRTVASSSRNYDPRSYHNGSVWPHDNVLIAAGMSRYGLPEAAQTIFDSLLEAAHCSPEPRLPELFCGFARRPEEPYVAYPTSCSPQAWAAGVPFPLLPARNL